MLSAAAEEEKLHQVTFNTNHVLCSSAAAAGCWILLKCSQNQHLKRYFFNINNVKRGQRSIRKEESMQNSDISPSTYVTAERRTEDTQFNMMDYRTGLLLLTVCWAERRTEDRGHTV
ncbi:hypothetical protein F7725_003630 [Dissostichus mawsoni]|uniref:Uncharacterized protein n=1 Tax=Dissostichus mawsoni TaxID=36200 RepID=A0A7J5YAR1_DISMA|nr:hypothetical protein F7725_003630 [Dissostichus mawsoni]